MITQNTDSLNRCTSWSTYWDDVYPSSVTVGGGASAPSFTAYNGNLRAYEFVGVGPTAKDMNLGFQFYHSHKTTGTMVLKPHLHLYVPDEASGGTIRFGCEYTWASINQAGTISTATIYGDLVRGAAAGINNNAILEFNSSAVSATGMGISSIFMCRIFRNPAADEDTFAASVWLKSADVHIEKDTLGSRLEYSK